jgi:hypothetical protein
MHGCYFYIKNVMLHIDSNTKSINVINYVICLSNYSFTIQILKLNKFNYLSFPANS